jgi:glycine/D-amino acid oxidase-like deaminating enzyme
VVGGGISGLYCASVLSKHGHKVTVFDMGKHAPGLCPCVVVAAAATSNRLTQAAQQLTDIKPLFCTHTRWPPDHPQDELEGAAVRPRLPVYSARQRDIQGHLPGVAGSRCGATG